MIATAYFSSISVFEFISYACTCVHRYGYLLDILRLVLLCHGMLASIEIEALSNLSFMNT